MRRFFLYLGGFIVLLVSQILTIYWIMPFPGSQESNMAGAAYFMQRYIWLFRIAGFLLMAAPLYHYIVRAKWLKKICVILSLGLYAAVFYFTTEMAVAERMFRQPQTKIFAGEEQNKIGKYNQVIGVEINGEARAYPVELIGFHHQVQDTVGGTPVMVTYCTVCRTGRIFSPVINHEHANFRLVGMDSYNAMFEDDQTKSWWRQETGECIAGKLKGKFLEEILSEQMSLKSWFEKYPDAKIMQPDPHYVKQYTFLDNYDEGTLTDPLEKTNWNSWELKSWVVGVKIQDAEKAYDWNDLQKQKIINDTIKNFPVLILLEDDTISFHVYERALDTMTLEFTYNSDEKIIRDTNTHSDWNFYGECTEGALQGTKLKTIQAYQEFWHAWKEFHPETTKYYP